MYFTPAKLVTFILFNFLFFTAHSEGINFQQISLSSALKKAEKEHKKVFVDVFAVWCGPCKYLTNNVFTDELLGNYMNEHFISIKIDGEDGEGIKLMEEFSIDAYPTLLFLNPDRTLLKKVVGAMEAEALKEKAIWVITPEQTSIYQMGKRYKSGDRDKEFLSAYLLETYNDDGDYTEILNEYNRLYPNLDLSNSADFMVFGFKEMSVDEPLVQSFLSQPEKYFELYGDTALEKAKDLLMNLADVAKEKQDFDMIDRGLNLLYPALVVMIEGLDVSQEELRASVIELYEEE
jgi:thiol-disulfide isomerase/thioredoxin